MRDAEATCIGCGYTDSRACAGSIEGLVTACFWLAVDRKACVGVCSRCPDELRRWKAGHRTVKARAAHG